MKKVIILAVSIILLAFIASRCGKARPPKEAGPRVPVKVMKVAARDLSRTLEYVGNITGQDEAAVYPKITGKIVEKVKEEGSLIEKGEAIAYIDRDEVGLTFEKAPVESPLHGIVGRIYVDIGSYVTPQTPVALISNMDKAEIDLDIPEKYLPQVVLGQRADITVDAYPRETFRGTVANISPVVDLQTRAAPVEIIIDNADHHLQSGMYARVGLVIGEEKGVPVILKEAVIGREPNTYVYTVKDGTAALKKVTLGMREGPYYGVTEGLGEGDLVVIMGQQKLRDGARVIVEEEKEW